MGACHALAASARMTATCQVICKLFRPSAGGRALAGWLRFYGNVRPSPCWLFLVLLVEGPLEGAALRRQLGPQLIRRGWQLAAGAAPILRGPPKRTLDV